MLPLEHSKMVYELLPLTHHGSVRSRRSPSHEHLQKTPQIILLYKILSV